MLTWETKASKNMNNKTLKCEVDHPATENVDGARKMAVFCEFLCNIMVYILFTFIDFNVRAVASP